MEPNPEIARLAARRGRLETQLKEVRANLVDLIREDKLRGVRQVDLVKAAGLTREQIRRICEDSAESTDD
jgi:predicted nucleotidyltransferase